MKEYWLDDKEGIRLLKEVTGKKVAMVNIEENRFGFEPEITAKAVRAGCRIYEVGISYCARTYGQGKKIGFKDAVSAVRCIIKYNLIRTGGPKGGREGQK